MVMLKAEYAKSAQSRCCNTTCKEKIAKGELRIGTATMMPGADTPTYKWRHVCCFTKRQAANLTDVEAQVEGLEELKSSDRTLIDQMANLELEGRLSMRACGGDDGPVKSPARKPRAKAKKAAPPPKGAPPAAVGSASFDSDTDQDDEVVDGNLWEWYDGSKWHSMDPVVSTRLTYAFADGDTTVKVKSDGRTYTVDLVKMTQTNLDSGKERHIRLGTRSARSVSPKPKASPKPARGLGSPMSSREEPPAAPAAPPRSPAPAGKGKYDRLDSDSGSSTEELPSGSPSRAPSAPGPTGGAPPVDWQYLSDKGNWNTFKPKQSQYLESKLQAGLKECTLDLSFAQYTINLVRLTQSNADTHTKRQLRRVGPDGSPAPAAPKAAASAGASDRDDRSSSPKRTTISTYHSSPKRGTSPAAKRRRANDSDDESEEGEPFKHMAEREEEEGGFRPKHAGSKASAVDKYSGLAGTGHVYVEGKDAWCCMLNQTNIAGGANNNKFYVIQLVEHDTKPKFWVFTRWGRVGVAGASKCENFSDLSSAQRNFMTKFREKTKNSWDERAKFVKYPGKYQLMEMDAGDESDLPSSRALEKIKDELPDSKLDKRVQDLVTMISDVKMMTKALADLDVDTERMPLGKISKGQIKKGFEILRKMSEMMASGKTSNLGVLSGEFYTLIPHDVGMCAPPLINDLKSVKKKMELLDCLADLEIANRLLKGAWAKRENPIDATYRQLNASLRPVPTGSACFDTICKAVRGTHGPTHTTYDLTVRDILQVDRSGEGEVFKKDMPNRRLLWHGSRLSNLMGIFSQGLRIAPPEAPVTGYMFGKGIYFADVCSKSANYCHATPHNPGGLLLLCDVALGNELELTAAKYMDHPPSGYQSTKGLGTMAPDPKGDVSLDEESGVLATGKPRNQSLPDPASALVYNEFVVYDIRQVYIRYIVVVDFNFKK